MEITIDDIKHLMPATDKPQPTDEYYLTLAKYVHKLIGSMHVFPELEPKMRKQLAIAAVGYFADVVSDAGMWRSFVQMCRKLYGRPVPFYPEPENYVDYELNEIDIRFIIWYSLESQLGFRGLVSPYDADIKRLAAQLYKLFDYLYADAPAAGDFAVLSELDLADPEQVKEIFKVSGWLFWNSYFLRPVSKHAYEPDVPEDDELTIDETLTDAERLHTTFEQPTGPLALTVREWLDLMLNGNEPKEKKKKHIPETEAHEYYRALMKATGGKPIAFCRTYPELEAFLSDKLGWGKNPEGHLPQLKGHKDFVLFADPEKGLVVAKDIAACIKHPDNPCYNPKKAPAEAHRLLMEPTVCAGDLLRYLLENDLLPDAAYPSGRNGQELLHDNWDFLARLYLRNHYRRGH